MIRYPSFFVIFLIIFSALSLYQVKHFITKKEFELAALEKEIQNSMSNFNILKAELSYLKRPDRLEYIARNKLNMKSILPIDIWDLEDLANATNIINNESLK